MTDIKNMLTKLAWSVKDGKWIFESPAQASQVPQHVWDQFDAQEIKPAVIFKGVVFESVSFRNYKFLNNLEFKNCIFNHPDKSGSDEEKSEITDGFWEKFLEDLTDKLEAEKDEKNRYSIKVIHDFTNITIERDLKFIDCHVFGQCDFYRMTCHGHIHLGEKEKPSRFVAMSMRQSQLNKLYLSRNSKVYEFLSVQNASIQQECEFRGYIRKLECERAHIVHACTLSGARIQQMKAKDMWVEGRFQAINTHFEYEADFSLATFSGLANFSNSIFCRGVRFSDASFKRNAFFDNTYLGPFSAFNRVSFDEILYFDPKEHSCVLWVDVLLNGPLRTQEHQTRSAFNAYWEARFLAWSSSVKHVGSPKDAYKAHLESVKDYFFEIIRKPQNHKEIVDFSYRAYLENEKGYWNALVPKDQGQDRSSAQYYFDAAEAREGASEKCRIKDKEKICGALKSGYRNALCEREEDFAFYESRECERLDISFLESPVQGTWLTLMKTTGYGTSPEMTLASMSLVGVLLIGLRSYLLGFNNVWSSIYAFFKLLIGAESAEVLSGLAVMDITIALFGFVSLTFVVLTISHKTNRS